MLVPVAAAKQHNHCYRVDRERRGIDLVAGSRSHHPATRRLPCCGVVCAVAFLWRRLPNTFAGSRQTDPRAFSCLIRSPRRVYRAPFNDLRILYFGAPRLSQLRRSSYVHDSSHRAGRHTTPRERISDGSFYRFRGRDPIFIAIPVLVPPVLGPIAVSKRPKPASPLHLLDVSKGDSIPVIGSWAVPVPPAPQLVG